MLSLRVISQQGKPPASPLHARFDAGGTIGRSPGCTLALPDPNRHISREQARIDRGPTGFVIHCTGSASGFLLNGAEIAPGESAALRPGDSLIVAEYEIAVESPAQLPAQPLVQSPAIAPSAIGRSGTLDDPFAALGLGPPAAPLDDPLGGFGLPPSPARSDAISSPADLLGLGAAASAGATNPVPTAADSLDAMFNLVGASPDPLGLGSGLAPPISMPNTALSDDPMASFGMKASPVGPSLPDTTAEIAGTFRLPDEIPPTSFGFGVDMAAEPEIPPKPQPIPRPIPQPIPQPIPVQPLLGEAAKPPGPSGAFFSWQQPGPEAGAESGPAAPRRDAIPTVETESSADHPGEGLVPQALAAEQIRAIADEVAERRRSDFEPPPRTRPTDFLNELNRAQVEALHAEIARSKARSATPAPASRHASADAPADTAKDLPVAVVTDDPQQPAAVRDRELLAGLLRGLGLAELPRSPLAPKGAVPTLSPELMCRLGELVRVGTQGTIDLLQARATLKREMKTEVTMIASRDNNPLKFSPDAMAALAHLLSTQSIRGFLDPVPALQDAFDDLLAHQVGFVAGMRAAMQGLIARFDPAVLESRLTRKSVLDSMLPGGRKARLWELFAELYLDISREAEDDFEALFGREFVRAYEQQIAHLQNDQEN